MATLLPVGSTPARRPFGVLDAPRLSKLSNVKNRQNGFSSLPSSLKRRQVTSDLSDSENVDPTTLKNLSTKRKRSAEDSDDVFKPTKNPTISLTTKPRLSISPMPSSRLDTPRLSSNPTPVSAPAAAGRSPKSSKRVGILSRSRRGLSRIDPPSFGAKPRNAAPQLSLAAALNGTMAYARPSLKAKHIPTIEESMPKAWTFNIHEDTPEEEMVNLMGHSTCTLDISDDESRLRSKDERGKENIPPMEVPVNSTSFVAETHSITVAATRKDMMTDEPRTPLGDLNPKDFYAEGCDAASYIVVPGDDSTEKPSSTNNIPASNSKLSQEFTLNCPTSSSTLLRKAELDVLISGGAPSGFFNNNEHDIYEADTDVEEDSVAIVAEEGAADLEIWESGSAKEEADEREREGAVVDSIFAI